MARSSGTALAPTPSRRALYSSHSSRRPVVTDASPELQALVARLWTLAKAAGKFSREDGPDAALLGMLATALHGVGTLALESTMRGSTCVLKIGGVPGGRGLSLILEPQGPRVIDGILEDAPAKKAVRK